MAGRLFTSESVTEGHPDKIADRISDSVLDHLMSEDPDRANLRVAVETLLTTGLVVVAGEITTAAWVDIETLARKVITDISAVKAAMPKVLSDVVGRAIQLHGSLGISTELPLGQWSAEAHHMALADGATELHQLQVAKQLLRGATPAPGLFPTRHKIALREAAELKLGDRLASVDDLVGAE